jgi:hypothetical protein
VLAQLTCTHTDVPVLVRSISVHCSLNNFNNFYVSVVEVHFRIALAPACAACGVRGLDDCSPATVRARCAATTGGEEAVKAGRARGGEKGIIICGVHSVTGHARTVCERGVARRGGVLVRGAGGALAVAAGWIEEGVCARYARIDWGIYLWADFCFCKQSK